MYCTFVSFHHIWKFSTIIYSNIFLASLSFFILWLWCINIGSFMLSQRSWYCFLISPCFRIGYILSICQIYWFYLILASLSYWSYSASFLFLISVLFFSFISFFCFFKHFSLPTFSIFFSRYKRICKCLLKHFKNGLSDNPNMIHFGIGIN